MLVAVLAAVLVVFRRPWSAAALVVAVGGAGIINTGLKELVRRQRPEKLEGIRQAGGYSFPSGHTTGSFVFFGMLPYLTWNLTRRRRDAIPLTAASILMTAFVGRSRVVLRHHHESDVLAAYGVGAAWLALVTRFFTPRIRRERL